MASASASVSAATAAPAAFTTYTCNAPKRKLCYTVKVLAALAKGNQAGCEVGAGGQWSEGESCPKENVAATCRTDLPKEVRYYYKGASLKQAETVCTSYRGTWEPASK